MSLIRLLLTVFIVVLFVIFNSCEEGGSCKKHEDCYIDGAKVQICIDSMCYRLRKFGEECQMSEQCVCQGPEQCTSDDKQRKCSKDGSCICIEPWFKYNETLDVCEDNGCQVDIDCEGALVCRNHDCVVKGEPRPNQPTPAAVFIVVAAILGGIVTITVFVVVIKSRLFKKSQRKSTLLLSHTE